MNLIQQKIRSMVRMMGYDVSKYSIKSNSICRLKHLISILNINVVLDVGANTGQTGEQLRRELKYENQIYSFEPYQDAFTRLVRRARDDDKWECFNYALGASDHASCLYVAGNSQSSSMLKMNDVHIKSEPTSLTTGRQNITVKKLDDLIIKKSLLDKNIFLKVDTQGYEREVLEGATDSLQYIKLCQLELSTIQLYQNSPLIHEIIDFMYSHGFVLADLKTGMADPNTGQLLQCDGLFMKR